MSTLWTSVHASTQKCNVAVSATQSELKIETRVLPAVLNRMAAEWGIPRSEIEARLNNVFYNFSVPVLIDRQIMEQAQYEAGVSTMKMARSVLREGTSKEMLDDVKFDRLTLYDISVNQEIAFIDFTVAPKGSSRLFISVIKGDNNSIIRPLTRRLLQEMVARRPSIVRLSLELMPADLFHISQAVRAGKSPEEAIKASPIFLALKAIGFSKIMVANLNPDGPSLTVERP